MLYYFLDMVGLPLLGSLVNKGAKRGREDRSGNVDGYRTGGIVIDRSHYKYVGRLFRMCQGRCTSWNSVKAKFSIASIQTAQDRQQRSETCGRPI
jgi:hypothetical protein